MKKATSKPADDTAFITRRQYEAYTEQQWKGTKVMLLEDIQNGNAKYPAGKVLTIERKRSGFELRGEKCACCGLTPLISSVNYRNLRILSQDEIDGLAKHSA